MLVKTSKLHIFGAFYRHAIILVYYTIFVHLCRYYTILVLYTSKQYCFGAVCVWFGALSGPVPPEVGRCRGPDIASARGPRIEGAG